MPGRLSVVATPIGHLDDITSRALATLRRADLVVCEDTRQTKKLLDHYQITTPTLSYHHHSGPAKVAAIRERLAAGQHIALVSDAGTPGISDPGNRLVRSIVESGTTLPQLEAIPGPSALAAAASLSGLPCDAFLFLGFLPHKKGRETLYRRIAAAEETVILYESPHRLMKTLEKFHQILSPDRPLVVLRELTKKFEERVGETVEQCWEYFTGHPDHVRGEFVLLIGGQ